MRDRIFSSAVLSFEESEIPDASIFVGAVLFASDIIVILLFLVTNSSLILFFFPLSSKFLERIMKLIILTNSKKCHGKTKQFQEH